MNKPIKNVLVAGYGIMGSGIALSFVRGGHRVTVLSRDPSRHRDLPPGISAVADLPAEPPDLVIETVPEQMALKQALFSRLETAYGDAPILATNTSGLDMEEMAAGLAHPKRFIGIHYFQPADALPLVEVIRTPRTTDEVLNAVVAALARNGQDALVLNRPIPGFLANRLQHAILHEAFYLIEQGVVSAEDVDKFAKKLFGPRLCVTGLLEQKDLSGLHTTAVTQRNLVPQLYHSDQPTRLLQSMVEAGNLGVKTGTGFYDWRTRDVEAHKRKAADKLNRILAIIAED